jgi:hypothetical protein
MQKYASGCDSSAYHARVLNAKASRSIPFPRAFQGIRIRALLPPIFLS